MRKPDSGSYLDAVHALDRVRYARTVQRFEAYHWQRHFLSSRYRFKVLDCARQAGKSTAVCVVPGHTAKFVPGSWSLIFAATEEQAVYDMLKVKQYMAMDPTFPALRQSSQSEVVLENDSHINVVCLTEKSARGPSKPRCIIIDEASRADEAAIISGVLPMLNGNPDCELIVLSTPNGKSGFFYRVMRDPSWERYIVRSPFTPVSALDLEQVQSEKDFTDCQRVVGIFGYYSPRHADQAEQRTLLSLMGQQLYRQENCAEFVEPEEQLLSYRDIAKAFQENDIQALQSGPAVREDIEALEPEST